MDIDGTKIPLMLGLSKHAPALVQAVEQLRQALDSPSSTD
jgi:hypothetical protein